MREGLYTDAVENAIEYKHFTIEELTQVVKEIDKDDWLGQWDKWWKQQSPAFQKEFDRIFKKKVKEFCNEENTTEN